MLSPSQVTRGRNRAVNYIACANLTYWFQQCRTIETRAKNTKARSRRWKPPPIADNVHVGSLKQTLDAHYAANRASLVRKIPGEDVYRDRGSLRPSSLDIEPEASTTDKKQTSDVAEKDREAAEDWKDKRIGEVGYRIPGLKARTKQGDHVYRLNSNRVRSGDLYSEWNVPRGSKDQTRPWLAYLSQTEGDPYAQLNKEMRAFEGYMKPKVSDRSAVYEVVRYTIKRVEELLPDFDAELVGSRATNLALPLSDIDIRIFPKANVSQDKDFSHSLKILHGRLKDDPDGKLNHVEYVNASVPIIESFHSGTGLKVQLKLEDESTLSDQYAKNYAYELPNLKVLYVVLRMMLEVRGLLGTFGGGLGAYSLLMMIVASMKHGHATSLPGDAPRQLLDFLHMFTTTDFNKICIAVDPPGFFDKHRKHVRGVDEIADPVIRGQLLMSKVFGRQPFLLCLQDPADPMNDLGRRSYAIQDVQRTFQNLRKRLVKEMELWDKKGPSQNRSLLGSLVGANYASFEQGRVRLRKYSGHNSGNVNDGPVVVRRVDK